MEERIGVLAVQGSFREHISALRRCGVEGIEIRTPQELDGLSGLIIPGGESTTIANVAERNGLLPALRDFEASSRPIWGTCAGLIFLADRAIGQKEGGQTLLGGLDCTVHRNFFGSQVNSFEADLPAPPAIVLSPSDPPSFRAVFIRAPAVVAVGKEVEVLAEFPLSEEEKWDAAPDIKDVKRVVVALRQGPLLATAFHPELTSDTRWHRLFVEMVRQHNPTNRATEPTASDSSVAAGTRGGPSLALSHPGDLPVYKDGKQLVIETKN